VVLLVAVLTRCFPTDGAAAMPVLALPCGASFVMCSSSTKIRVLQEPFTVSAGGLVLQ